ncbi:DsbA family protein [Terriglobus sp. ADX1]|uniref:DsbA family protein n=1 Tax=Terriglobus sp. ADX1 TaxID=2794063 RepID=UPI002FE68009
MILGKFQVTFTRMYLLAIPLLAAIGTVVWFQHVHPDSRCKVIDDGELSKITTYLRARLGIAESRELGVFRAGFLPGTCVQRIAALTGKGDKPSIYLVSNDGRYLFTQALDLSNLAGATHKKDDVLGQSDSVVDMGKLIADDRPSWGSSKAPVTIVEFSDFQCPFCKRLAKTLQEDVLPKEVGNVHLVFREFPLPMHKFARREAELAACTGLQGNTAFWALHDYLFASSTTVSDATQEDALKYLQAHTKADVKEIRVCVERHQMSYAVDQDIKLGQEYGVSGTPAVFINGNRIVGARDQSIYVDLINHSMKPDAHPARM